MLLEGIIYMLEIDWIIMKKTKLQPTKETNQNYTTFCL